jgi:hypothetical protein
MLSASENKFYSELAYHRGDLLLTSRPVVLCIESTNHCNVECVMCPRDEPDLMQREVGHMKQTVLGSQLNQGIEWIIGL